MNNSESTQPPIRMSLYKQACDFCSHLYFQYLIVTSVYMLEPLERKIVNSFFLFVFGMVMYTTYTFLPRNLMLLVKLPLYLLGMNNSIQQSDVF